MHFAHAWESDIDLVWAMINVCRCSHIFEVLLYCWKCWSLANLPRCHPLFSFCASNYYVIMRNCYQWTNWAWRYLVSESSFSCQSETFCSAKIFSLFFVCQVITLHHTKKMSDHIWVNEGVKFCKIHSQWWQCCRSVIAILWKRSPWLASKRGNSARRQACKLECVLQLDVLRGIIDFATSSSQ